MTFGRVSIHAPVKGAATDPDPTPSPQEFQSTPP